MNGRKRPSIFQGAYPVLILGVAAATGVRALQAGDLFQRPAVTEELVLQEFQNEKEEAKNSLFCAKEPLGPFGLIRISKACPEDESRGSPAHSGSLDGKVGSAFSSQAASGGTRRRTFTFKR